MTAAPKVARALVAAPGRLTSEVGKATFSRMPRPVEQNRPDGYPSDEQFDRAANRALEDRRADEEKAEEFLRQMDERLRAHRNQAG